MSETLVKVEKISKKFCLDLKKSLLYGMKDMMGEFIGKDKKIALRKSEFWAIRNISFEVKRGMCLGLIGHNGAGKSTLLKMLTGLIKPDIGTITIKGKIGALIELGVGFNGILTGKENIYINGSLLGFTKKEIDAKLESIIKFSELENFIESPVQTYSSGMKVRLGFAIASQMEPDILLIDEVLAVGDIGFRAKCYDYINSIINKTAIIFVSHSMPQVARVCDAVLNLDKGRAIFNGKTIEGIRIYNESFKTEITKPVIERIKLTKMLTNGLETNVVQAYGNDMIIELFLLSKEEITLPTYNISIIDSTQQYIYQVNNKREGIKMPKISIGENRVKFSLKELLLNPGKYSFSITIRDANDKIFYCWYHGVGPFTIVGNFLGASQYQGKAIWNNN